MIDADQLARAATDDPVVLQCIAAELGAELVSAGALDRAATAELVFANEGALAKLNAIIHPWVRQQAAARVRELREVPTPPPLIVQDVPLLFESGLESHMNAVLLVTAPFALRAERVGARSGLAVAEVRKRDAAQWSQERKADLADYIIDNSGDEAALRNAVGRVWTELRRRGKKKPRI